MSTRLHPVTRVDWRLLRDVRLRALADSPDAFGSTLAEAEALDEPDWRERADNAGLTLVAVEDGAGLAMAGALAPDGGPTAFVWGMWTDPAARGRGLAGELLDELVAWCRGTGRSGAPYDRVRLHVTEGNDGARRLYLGRGFVPTGVWEPLRDGSTVRIEELALDLRS